MKGIWAEGKLNEKNISLVFTLSLENKQKCEMKIAGGSCFKVFADGKFIGFGPNRAAHGYARVINYQFEAKNIAVEIVGYNIKSFWLIKQPPFFWCDLKTEEKNYTHNDFTCRILTDRVQKVPKFSYQRCFSEVYSYNGSRGDYSSFPTTLTQSSVEYKELESYTENVNLNVLYPNFLREGRAYLDEEKPVWRDRQHENIGKEIDGFTIEEWEDQAIDDLSKTVFSNKGNGKYFLYDFGRAITGFIGFTIKVEKPSVVYIEFDEMLVPEENGNGGLKFYRNCCANSAKWTLKTAGEYDLSTFEPYTVRFLRITIFNLDKTSVEKIEFKPYVIDYENPQSKRLKFSVADADVEKILEAARNTIAQNSADILTDCPSRERAGWLADSYFSSVAERAFTGYNKAEKAHLENYAYSDRTGYPKGIIPMCYPADNFGDYIPNWCMWYVYEIVKYAKTYGKDELVDKSYETVKGIVNYFDGKTNEFGLLENLEGWRFIEWSDANKWDRVCGVNVPSNFCWSACLTEAGKLFGEQKWVQAGEKAKKAVLELGYDGKFFVDNLVREGGQLVRTNHYTEVCQYYGFWFNIIDKKDYPELYAELMNNLGLNRKEGYLPEVGKPNAIFGIYMREDLWMREGERRKLYEECKGYFLQMAEKTGTLWENVSSNASLDHGFAAYVVKWIIYALTGYDVEKDEQKDNGGIGIKCEFVIPRGDKTVTVKA